jgi:citronellol/citronellal dehydrogenase
MTLVAHGLAEEVKGTGVSINALWPATMVESYATINHKLGDRSMWRKASIISDCCLALVQEKHDFSGHALIDEDYLKSRGVADLSKYRCDPNVEPPRITAAAWSGVADGVGTMQDVKSRVISPQRSKL